MNLTLEIRGYLVGPIWMPATECFKDLAYNITREDGRFTEPGTLRDHVLSATNDGDFQHCAIAHGELVATRTVEREGRRTTVSRAWPLDCFKSIADCLADPDWYSDYGDE